MTQAKRILDFYGCRIAVESPADLALPQLSNEFVYFDSSSSEPVALTVKIVREKPVIDRDQWLRPCYYTPRNICYLNQGQKIINYHNQAVLKQSADGSEVEICSLDPDLLQAIAYTVIIYQSGNYFDRIGRFRVHALGFTFNQKGVLVLLPIGGGKSTLLLKLLKDPRIKLLSEDTPLITSGGLIYPFPIKIGVIAGQLPQEIPPEYIVELQQLEGPRKEVINLAYFKDKIETRPANIAAVFLGERFLGEQAKMVPVSTWKAWRRFFRDCVVGLGVYQGLEFAVNSTPFELWRYGKRGLQRALTCASFVKKARNFEFQMGTDPSRNADLLLEFLEVELKG